MKRTKIILTLVASGALALCTNAWGASDSALALQQVGAALSIGQDSDLDFGTAVQGDPSKTVAPGSSENSENASFTVTGEPNSSYSILIPVPMDANIQMITGAGGVNETIDVYNFQSNPAEGANGLLDGLGSQRIYVGATRAALSPTQVVGSYSASFNVQVVY